MSQSKALNSPSQVLLAEDLRKSYRRRPALRGLSFSLQAGRILGFLGPNGAGKTTAIRILTTILESDSGIFFVDGISSEYPQRIRGKIGVLPESLGFPKQITGIELLTYFGQLYGRTENEARTHSAELLEEVGLQERANSLVGTYSRGMRQRLGIARALINDPTVVFLDEPTLGLDPRGQQELLLLVQKIARERYAGVILCSHLLSEIEDICDDVVILMSGQIIASGSVTEVVQHSKQNMLRVHIPGSFVLDAQRTLEALSHIKRVSSGTGTAGWLAVEQDHSTDGASPKEQPDNNRILEALIRAGIPILSYESEGGLKDVFLQLTDEVIK
ncbi:MAG: ABC transporter ATP-binding protein [Anaerolineales bacterium]|nr:ABC transporter ATP-binding protein [Anaerolineales bacterium]